VASTSPYAPPVAAAASLLQSLQAMGEARSNAVLELLGDPPVIQQGQRYPADKLRFGADWLRAYYHCHAEPWPREGEHGHFHFFLPLGDKDKQPQWAHLAALSINDEGQPQRWFTVNNWVTGGPWLGRQDLSAALTRALTQRPQTLLEQWLLAMLGMYAPDLASLLQQRDQDLHRAAQGQPLGEVHQDRDIYTLATQDIHLATDLQNLLTAPTTKREAINC